MDTYTLVEKFRVVVQGIERLSILEMLSGVNEIMSGFFEGSIELIQMQQGQRDAKANQLKRKIEVDVVSVINMWLCR